MPSVEIQSCTQCLQLLLRSSSLKQGFNNLKVLWQKGCLWYGDSRHISVFIINACRLSKLSGFKLTEEALMHCDNAWIWSERRARIAYSNRKSIIHKSSIILYHFWSDCSFGPYPPRIDAAMLILKTLWPINWADNLSSRPFWKWYSRWQALYYNCCLFWAQHPLCIMLLDKR